MKVLTAPQSGSHNGITAGHNRFGQYLRSRSIPVNPRSGAQGLARGRLSGNSSGWRLITANQRAGWGSLGSMMTRTDALGQTYTLQANQAYVSVNSRLLCGLAVVADAPAYSTPATIATATITTTAGTLSIAYTPTPMPAATFLAVFASPQRSAGRAFEGDFRYVLLSTAAQASPVNPLANYSAKFGIPVVGNRIFFSLVSISLGFESAPLITSVVVTA
jgi:hypothetical protein